MNDKNLEQRINIKFCGKIGKSAGEMLALNTFKTRASYIQDGRTATLQMLHFIYIFATNISTEYFKHAAHSPFFSSKCSLFRNATVLVLVLFKFYVQGVLKFKCKIRVPKG
jgi:hypothetical protein